MNKELLKLTFPNIISNITVPLLGMADIAMMGRMENANYIGAIALGSMIFNFIYWGFSFLRMGTSGLSAQAYGRQDKSESIHILVRSLFIAIIGSIVIWTIQVPIKNLSFELIKSTPEVERLAIEYFRIRIWAAPATISLYAFTGWFLGMQNAKAPMFIALLVNLANLFLNLLFIFVFGMKSDGVAIGTVISQYIGLTIAILIVLKKYPYCFKFFSKKLFWQISQFLIFFNLSKDIFIRTFLLILVISFLQAESAKDSSNILAINNIMLQFFTLFSYIIDGFAHAAEAISGKYYGAKEKRKFFLAVKLTFQWAFLIAGFFSITYLLAGNSLIDLFTNIEELKTGIKPYFFWVYLIPLLSFSAFIWDGIFIGITASKGLRNSMLISTFLFFVLYYSLTIMPKNHALWLSFSVFLLSRGISQTFIYTFSISKKI